MTLPIGLLLIDVQKGFDFPNFGQRNNPKAEENIAELLTVWRHVEWPVIHIQHNSKISHSPLFPGQVGNEIKAEALPIEGETLFGKQVNSAFIGTNLENHLREKDIQKLVIVGLTTDHCVSTTTRMAANLGFDVILASDATATFERKGMNGKMISTNDIHNINLATLNDEFCQVKSTAEIKQWISSSVKRI